MFVGMIWKLLVSFGLFSAMKGGGGHLFGGERKEEKWDLFDSMNEDDVKEPRISCPCGL